jgi:uncharacterized protein
MLLKLLLLGAILYGLYRLAGGKILPAGRSRKEGAGGKSEAPDEETMVECHRCSTYVLKKEALFYKGRYYCSRECLPEH